MPGNKLGDEVDGKRQEHQDRRDGEGHLKLALFFCVDIKGDGERCAGARQAVKNSVQRVGKAGGKEQCGGFS